MSRVTKADLLAVKQQAERAWKAAAEAHKGQGGLQAQLHRALAELDSLRAGAAGVRDRVRDLETHGKARQRLLAACRAPSGSHVSSASERTIRLDAKGLCNVASGAFSCLAANCRFERAALPLVRQSSHALRAAHAVQASEGELAGVKDAVARLQRQAPREVPASRPPSAPSGNLAAQVSLQCLRQTDSAHALHGCSRCVCTLSCPRSCTQAACKLSCAQAGARRLPNGVAKHGQPAPAARQRRQQQQQQQQQQPPAGRDVADSTSPPPAEAAELQVCAGTRREPACCCAQLCYVFGPACCRHSRFGRCSGCRVTWLASCVELAAARGCTYSHGCAGPPASGVSAAQQRQQRPG